MRFKMVAYTFRQFRFLHTFFASLRSLRSSGPARCATVSSSHASCFTSTPGNTLCCVTWCWDVLGSLGQGCEGNYRIFGLP